MTVPFVIGDVLPPMVRQTGLAAWNRYAAVNDEFYPIHMDDHAARAAGMAGAIGMGNLQWSYLHVLVRNWLGDRGRIVRLHCEFRSPDTGGTVTARGRIAEIRQDGTSQLIDVEVWTEDESGNLIAAGSATVEV
jgi:acyl dehydratase